MPSDIENQPRIFPTGPPLRGELPADLNRVGGPLVIATAERHRESEATTHTHNRGQLMIAMRGLITVRFVSRIWIVPPGHSVWLAPCCPHSLRCHGRFERSGVYIDELACTTLAGYPMVIQTSTLLRDTLLRIAEWPESDAPLDTRSRRIVDVLIDEIRILPVEPLELPMPRDPRLERVAQALIEYPMADGDLDSWARFAGISTRSLSRGFLAYTGFSFADWRQRARLLRSLELLTTGLPISIIARDLGYATAGAYASVFRRTFGESPTDYRQRFGG